MHIISVMAAVVLALGNTAASPPLEASTNAQIKVAELSSTRFELVYSGARFTSRDAPERELLLASSKLALAHGQTWFVLLPLSSERSDVHPARPNPSFGAKYGHWQPHWSYYTRDNGWQWWHPEWGDDFWTKDLSPSAVERFEVHAMIDLGRASADDGLEFNASEIAQDLRHPAEVHTDRQPH